jgi:hypothetical protein
MCFRKLYAELGNPRREPRRAAAAKINLPPPTVYNNSTGSQRAAASTFSSDRDWDTEPNIPPCALIIASPISWNSGK